MILPIGHYFLEVIAISTRRVSMAGNHYRLVQLVIPHTTSVTLDPLYWMITDAPTAKRTWNDVLYRFEDAEQLIGRIFLFTVWVEEYNGMSRNRVGSPIAELII